MQVNSKHIGALVGLAFGWMVVEKGFVVAVFLAAMALAGWAVGRVIDGELDVSQYLRRRDDL
jgi:uncharacterized membrane protein